MTQILFPVGRMVGGSVHTPYAETDNRGNPKLGKDGQARKSFNFGVAIPKGQEQHWNQTPWGNAVWNIGASAFPREHGLPVFAWKIKDGDSTVPNRRGNIPAQMEGYAGHWVIWFKQGWAPKLVTDKGTTTLLEPESIVPGYYVEVFAEVTGNSGETPGVYMNPIAVNRVAFGERIITAQEVDTTSVGFGTSPLPAGASATPVGGGFVPPDAPTAPTPITPNPAFLAVPPTPPAPPAAPTHVMLPAAGGATYEQMIGAGWTDALLVQHGMMAA